MKTDPDGIDTRIYHHHQLNLQSNSEHLPNPSANDLIPWDDISQLRRMRATLNSAVTTLRSDVINSAMSFAHFQQPHRPYARIFGAGSKRSRRPRQRHRGLSCLDQPGVAHRSFLVSQPERQSADVSNDRWCNVADRKTPRTTFRYQSIGSGKNGAHSSRSGS